MKQEALICPGGKQLVLNRLNQFVADIQEGPFTTLPTGYRVGNTIAMVVTGNSIEKQPITCPDCTLPTGCSFTYGKKT
ncbi:MAG: hypothetical protein V1917_00160 [Candidatus Gottesmanbacteria bacterium]